MNIRRNTLYAALCVTVALALGAPAVAAAQEVENFRALAQSTTFGLEGQARINIQITRWSTDEEADHLTEILLQQDMEQLAQALRDQPEVGHIRVPGEPGPGWRLRYAEEYREGDTRTIILATDRPISFWEAVERPMPLWKYQVSLIELRLDANDEGEGAIAVGVELGVDAESGTLLVKHLEIAPIRLVNVRK